MTVYEPVDRDSDENAGKSGGSGSAAGLGTQSSSGPGGDLRDLKSSKRADAVFRGLTVAAGAVVVALIALIGIVLVMQATPSLMQNHVNFFTSSEWNTTDPENMRFGILDLLKVTVLSSIFALVLAVPVSIGISTFLVQYAPPRLSRTLSALIDLLAAVPSIIYGMWGLIVLGPWMVPFAVWLNENLNWIFLFGMTCFPYAKSGMIAGSMLALGRALGETVAVLIILRAASSPSTLSLFDGGFTFASKIAAGAAEFNHPLPTGAYIAAGLVLFVLTFIVNLIARSVSGGKVNG